MPEPDRESSRLWAPLARSDFPGPVAKPRPVTARPRKPLKILHLSSLDHGGAGNSAYRLYLGQRRLGIDAHMMVLGRRSGDQQVIELRGEVEQADGSRQAVDFWTHMLRRWQSVLAQFPNRPGHLEMFTTPECAVGFDKMGLLQDIDVINLHWVAGLLDYERMALAFAGKKVVWTLHDMNAFTGGCHYAGDCDKYRSSCAACPQLGVPAPEELARQIWEFKERHYREVELHIVTPSRWLGECSRSSGLLSRFRHTVIPYGLDIAAFSPRDPDESKRRLQLTMEKRIVLFGADVVANHRKGFHLLLQALQVLDAMQEPPAYELVCFGRFAPEMARNLPVPVHVLGHLDSVEALSAAYSAADVFVLPSQEDNLPNTVLESLACGTPVVGFRVGGMPDMVDHGQTGYLAAPYDVADLAQGIREVLTSTNAAMRQRCRSVAEERYPLEKQAQAYSDLYESLSGGVDATRRPSLERVVADLTIPAPDTSAQTAPQTSAGADSSSQEPAFSLSFGPPAQEDSKPSLSFGDPASPPAPSQPASPPSPPPAPQAPRQQQPLPTSPEIDVNLCRRKRRELAEIWLGAEDAELEAMYQGDAGQRQRVFLDSGCRDFPLTEEEDAFAAGLIEEMGSKINRTGALKTFLALMLYKRAFEYAVDLHLNRVPPWLLKDYWIYLIEPVTVFWKPGDADAYCSHMQNLIEHLHKRFATRKPSQIWQTVGPLFAEKANFISLYFSGRHLREIYAQRADIATCVLEDQDASIDYDFPVRASDRKIRVGVLMKAFLSLTETFASLPVFEHLDRDRFELILFALGSDNNPIERHCRSLADRFVVLPQELPRQVQQVRAEDLDILFFGNNLTAVTNLPFVLGCFRLARKQVVHFCQPLTTGQPNIDGFLIGSLAVPERNAEELYSERLLPLDGSGICFNYTLKQETPTIRPARRDLNIGDEQVVFVSGANFFKILPELRRTWVDLLAALPSSVLVLYPFGPAWAPSYPKQPFIDDFGRLLDERDVVRSRVTILEPLPTQADIQQVVKLADIYLDGFPYSGATSLLDPLSHNVPPVVMEGNDLRSRQGAAMLREVGLDDLVARNEQEYIALASRLANERAFRESMAGRIGKLMRENPPFLDGRAYARKVEDAFRALLNT